MIKVFKFVVRVWEFFLSCVYRGGFFRVLKVEFLDLDCLGDNIFWVKKIKLKKYIFKKVEWLK